MPEHCHGATVCNVTTVSDLLSQEQGLPALDESWSRALCVAAHPDDLEYGIAAAVDHWHLGQLRLRQELKAMRVCAQSWQRST